MKQALVLYSNGGENEVVAPTWEEAHEAFLTAIKKLHEIAPTPKEIDVESLEPSQIKEICKSLSSFR